VLVMFSLFCPLPCLRGVLEFAPSVSNVLIILSTSMSSWSETRALQEDMEVDKIMRALLTLGATRLRGVLEFAPSVSNVLIMLSTSISSWSARVCL
jgi:allophanate hydrolase subunit 1